MRCPNATSKLRRIVNAADPNTPAVSIVVPTYNEAPKLTRFLESVDAQTGVQTFEIVVVDDCSVDETEDVAREWVEQPRDFDARYIRQPENAGPARARNTGTEAARGDVVAYTDSDCVLDPNWLAHLPRKLDADARVGGVGGKVLPLDPNGLFAQYYTFQHALDPPPSLLYLVTVNCCYLREPVLEVGGFDESVRRPGGEDIALSLKLWQRGWRFAFEDEAVCHHDYRESYQNFYRTWWNYGAGSSRVTEKYLRDEVSGMDVAPDEPDWYDNPLTPPAFTAKRRIEDLRGTFGGGRDVSGSLWTGLRFALLRWLQLRAYTKGWHSGEQAE